MESSIFNCSRTGDPRETAGKVDRKSNGFMLIPRGVSEFSGLQDIFFFVNFGFFFKVAFVPIRENENVM